MTFRAPLFTYIYPRSKAQPEYVVNLTPQQHPNPPQPFVQSDWPRTSDPTRWKYAVGDVYGTLNALLTPNPAQPFVENDWPALPRLPLSLKSDVYNSPNPSLTPNPAAPFNQYEWRSPARVPLSLKSDVYSWIYPLYEPNPAQPFAQSDWPRPLDPKKAIGEALGGDSPLLTPNPARPFSQSDWFQVQSATKAKVDDFVNLAPVQSGAPFIQSDWPLAIKSLEGNSSDFVNLSPLYTVFTPFLLNDWPRPASIPLKARFDDVANLLPVQSVVVVVTPAFVQTDWPLTATLRSKASGEALGGDLPLFFAPNPPRPFSQGDWPSSHGFITNSDKGVSYGLNLNFPPPPPGQTAFFTVSGSEVRDRFPTTSVSFNYATLFSVPSNDSRRTN